MKMKNKNKLDDEEEFQCTVCGKFFKPKLLVGQKLDDEHAIMEIKYLLCSDECRKIWYEVESNQAKECYYCKKKVAKKDIGAGMPEIELRRISPICNKCLYPEDYK
jgi:uncharacterized Zn-finger protein